MMISRKIAVLRGINVGGKRKLLMSDLKPIFEELGFTNVTTYIQSGNVIFDSETPGDNSEIAQKIEKRINKKFNYEVPVVIRTYEELKSAMESNPFIKEGCPIEHLGLVFLNVEPAKENLLIINNFNYEPDKFVVHGKDAFIYIEGKYHKSKLTNNFFEKKLKVKATTRNWKTVSKLLELSSTN